jgi:predicted transcriptional regulator
MQVPSPAELERWFDAERANEVHFVESVASWPSLRVLDHLYASGPATTGEISRALNMDMRDVKDCLDVLETHAVVTDTDEGWEATVDQINITLTQRDGLAISHTLGGKKRPAAKAQTDQYEKDETEHSMISGLYRKISSLFR